MRPKSTEKTLIDLYRLKKYDYFEVKTYIEKWIDHFNVAGRYDYRINKERETLPDILEKSLLNGCIPKADRVSAKQIIHIPDIYVKFGATPEECLKFKIIDNIADSPLANLSEEKLKNLIDARYNHNSAKVTQTAAQNVATMQPEVIMDGPINTQATNAITPDLASELEFRIGSLTAELSQLYSSKWFAGKKWENALDTCVRTLVVKKEIDNSIIYYAFELAHKIVCENSYPISGTKIKIFLTFAENYAITLDSMIKVGVDECIALKKLNAIAVSAMNLAIQEMNRNQRKSFSIEKYLHFYGTEYFRRKKHDPEIQSELVTVGKKDSYIDDGRPSLEQYILARTHMDPKTGLVYIQMPTGEAKSYTIEEIICKAIKGIDGYKDILERYKRIVVTTIQNKLIDPDAYMTKHGIYNLTQEEFDNNIVVVRGLLENLRKNFKRIKELTPIDIQGSAPFQQLEIAYNNLTTDPEIHKNWNTSSDIDLVDSKDGGNLQQELALAYGQLRKSVTGEGSSFFKAAEERAKSRHELTRADKDVSWTNLDPKERARLVRAEKSRLVVEDSDFEWMTLLWPSLLVPHRKVILSTVSKLQYPSFSFETDDNDMNDLPYISWTKDAILFADEGDASKQYQEMAYIKNQSAEVYDLKLLLCRIYEQFDAALGNEKTDPRRIKDVWKRLSARYAYMYNIRIRAKDGEAPNYIKNMEDLFQSLQKLVNTYHLTARFKSTSYVNKEMVTYVYAGGADFSTGGISSKACKNAVFAAFYNKNGVVDIHRLTVQEGKSLEDLKKELLERYADLYDENSEINLRSMTAAMRKFAIDFAKQIHKLAIAYQDEYQEANSQKNKEGSFARLQMSERSAWRNVLRALGIDDEHHTCADFLRNLIPPILPGKIYGKMSPFYTYGWSATSLISDIDNQEDLRFWGFGVPTTAERILGTEATHGLVFCLSGTMDIESSISNYNRRELSKMLGSDYIASLSDDLIWKKHIEAELNDKWRPYYDGIITHTDEDKASLSSKSKLDYIEEQEAMRRRNMICIFEMHENQYAISRTDEICLPTETFATQILNDAEPVLSVDMYRKYLQKFYEATKCDLYYKEALKKLYEYNKKHSSCTKRELRSLTYISIEEKDNTNGVKNRNSKSVLPESKAMMDFLQANGINTVSSFKNAVSKRESGLVGYDHVHYKRIEEPSPINHNMTECTIQYIVGELSLNQSLAKAAHVYTIRCVSNSNSQYVKEDMDSIVKMVDVFFVRENAFTVIPFLCKYAREWERVDTDHFEEALKS